MISVKSITYQPISEADAEQRMQRLIDLLIGKDEALEELDTVKEAPPKDNAA